LTADPAPTTDAVEHVSRFQVMGTEAQITVIDGDPGLLHLARLRLEALEARWSRFRSGSDTTALNLGAGSWVPVSPETLLLLDRAVAGARATDGRFDPTVGAALIAHGYDRTFTQVEDHARSVIPRPMIDASWPAIELDAGRGLACLPPGTTFDPGAIGKGVAADLIIDELADRAAGMLVNLGGDLRMTGLAPHGAGWIVAIDDPHEAGRELGRIAVPSGAVATSSRMERRWETAEGPAHHVIDPTTGRPSTSDAAAVTVVAGEAWWAEVQATSLFLQGSAGIDGIDAGVHAVVIRLDGTRRATPALAEVLS
jgi:thiamine biosynthesis lipoprotein